MRTGTVLVTGGAGFIGAHVCRELLQAGYEVRALDNLNPQVHGRSASRPSYLDPNVELVVGDVRDAGLVTKSLTDVESVVHLAAAVGVGQSMYQLAEYTSVNNLGTAVLLEALIPKKPRKLVVASSMSLYGEGRYRSQSGEIHDDAQRSLKQLKQGIWEPFLEGKSLLSVPTPEDKRPDLSSVYALSKYDQERLCLLAGRAYEIPTVALRFFNVYGPYQALSNPYTGVLAIFAARLLNDRRPLVFEDGAQRRDFVSVHDVARACRLALESSAATQMSLNIGSGSSVSIVEVARRLAKVLGKGTLEPEITGRYRMGDIRHCFADISQAEKLLGYSPQVSLEQGLTELSDWLRGQQPSDLVSEAQSELEARGLAL